MPEPDPILIEVERADAARAEALRRSPVPGRSGLPSVGRTTAPARERPGREPAGGPADGAGMKPWMAVLGVFVLVQAGALVHPVLGLLVLALALAIGVRRWWRRRRGG